MMRDNSAVEIVDWPEIIRPSAVAISPRRSLVRRESPFSGKSKSFQGQFERWGMTLTLTPMKRAQVQVLESFMLTVGASAIRVGDFSRAIPIGSTRGGGRATGTRGEFTVATSGWTPNQLDVLAMGDWIQVGNQLLKVTSSAHSSPTGAADLNVWPRLRKDYDDEMIVTHSAKGIFYLDDSPIEVSTTAGNGTWDEMVIGLTEVIE